MSARELKWAVSFSVLTKYFLGRSKFVSVKTVASFFLDLKSFEKSVSLVSGIDLYTII